MDENIPVINTQDKSGPGSNCIDGVLHKNTEYPKRNQSNIIKSHIKDTSILGKRIVTLYRGYSQRFPSPSDRALCSKGQKNL